MTDEEVTAVPVLPDAEVFQCANCGAVSLFPENICKVQGKLKKKDWCGTEGIDEPKQCYNNKHNLRFVCNKCSRVAVNSEILCNPEMMDTD